MVRCEKFYEQFEKKGNFCRKSSSVVKKVESYIEYMNRNKFGDFNVSNNAIEPFIQIEHMNQGKVHGMALKELRKKIRRVGASGITRRISIEIINKANSMVDESYKISSIPDIRTRIGSYEHAIEGIEHEVRENFDSFKLAIEAKDNNFVMKVMLEYCKDKSDIIKEMIERMKDENSKMINIVSDV